MASCRSFSAQPPARLPLGRQPGVASGRAALATLSPASAQVPSGRQPGVAAPRARLPPGLQTGVASGRA
eukprot:10458293-Lingulodinium_polyedra.AAC.1